ncbi:MAG: SDR family oxidoreductase [Bacteroidales bacterium]|jgi:NAD(P)-dependent dehydrogenase (short-subunit alcohol dehydrogenase family)|nr:SDR family oxidoreductase [Bacteroidales bacterium]
MNIVITGASKGIGFQTAKILASKSENRIFAVARNVESLNNINNNITPLAWDITQMPYKPLVEEIKKWSGGKVDVLINNAGIILNKKFEEISPQEFDLQFSAHVKSPFFLIQALLPLFSEGSHIVNISSMGGFQGSVKFSGLSAYSSSKGALAVLTEALAEELSPKNISVNAICPGAVQTTMLEKAFPGLKAPLSDEEMGGFLADFALNGHRFFNGKILPVSSSTP